MFIPNNLWSYCTCLFQSRFSVEEGYVQYKDQPIEFFVFVLVEVMNDCRMIGLGWWKPLNPFLQMQRPWKSSRPLKKNSPLKLLIQKSLHPWRLTWNLKMAPWKRRSLLETIIFRFYVELWGCTRITVISKRLWLFNGRFGPPEVE